MKKRIDECYKCSSRSCFYRIYRLPEFDEIACRDHGLDLERYADSVLDGKIRHHLSSSARVSRRLKPLPAIAYNIGEYA